ncbi:hypothetical protein Phi40:1_gp050 [Cellulophaga phage phi40:1]|uniref:Uncharacterized protein n=1 Tax=Cellulophaga phage phi38:1 TaxID=1327977 RepID=R9ZZY7_9CAUD|nr:hypothetical protein Phi38:1_gp050 [Cellulophaga phage phi38:1]AGO47915.1 hypothetical protein Phi40:1_gp050 [Cellulophaga phage phi40:1]AGO48080.1 hypothetical protein Phi38:1_gp050 [Cellulophaga phage phi38:1]
MSEVKVETARSKEDMVRLLNETVQYYSEDLSRRGVESKGSNFCKYRAEGGGMCAVGRCMLDGLDYGELNNRGGLYSLAGVKISTVDKSKPLPELDIYLKDEYKGYPVIVWEFLQIIHDDSANWKGTEASKLALEIECKEAIERISKVY